MFDSSCKNKSKKSNRLDGLKPMFKEFYVSVQIKSLLQWILCNCSGWCIVKEQTLGALINIAILRDYARVTCW